MVDDRIGLGWLGVEERKIEGKLVLEFDGEFFYDVAFVGSENLELF
jgi:hypothetical protein